MIDAGFQRDISAAFLAPIEAAMVEARAAEQPRDYLGASGLGYPCERRVAYSWFLRHDPAERRKEGRLLRIFSLGHHIETAKTEWISAAYDLRTHDEHGGQFAFSLFDGRFRGHCDGVLVGYRGPEGTESPVKFPALWECKGLGKSGFSQLRKDGLRAAYPHYWAQVQVYQGLIIYEGQSLREHPAVFTAMCKDDCEIHTELVPFEPEAFERLITRAEAILSADSPEAFDRITSRRNDFRCRFCPFAERCWGAAAKAEALPKSEGKPAWL